MTPTLRSRTPLLFAVAFLALCALPARATTIVPIADALLVQQAPVIVVGRVQGTLPNTTSRPETDWLVTVERVLKGEVTEGAIVVRVLGGTTAEGDRLTIYGAPRFGRDEQVILFVAPRPDGTWAIVQYLQGAFHAVPAGNRLAAVRDLTEVQVVTGRRRSGGTPALRDFDAFRNWIEDRAAGQDPPADYRFRPTRQQMKKIVAGFTLFESDGLNLRWFEFDGGGSVTWKAYQSGQPGLAGGGFVEFQRGLAAWNNESTTPIRLVYGGTSTATAGFQRFDRNNVLLFNDPNQDIEGTFDCAQGGTLAIGGPWSDSSVTGRFNRQTFVKIQGADIVMNDGIECSFPRSPNASKYMEEVYAHELGHTLGLADEYSTGYGVSSVPSSSFGNVWQPSDPCYAPTLDSHVVAPTGATTTIPWVDLLACETPLDPKFDCDYDTDVSNFGCPRVYWPQHSLPKCYLASHGVDAACLDYVGLFEGAFYMSDGCYRAAWNCKMRDSSANFCAVCDAWIRKFFECNYVHPGKC